MQVLFTHKSVQNSGVVGENVLGIKISNDLSTSLTLSIQPFSVNCDIKIPASTPPALSALPSPILLPPSPSLPALDTGVKAEEEPESVAFPPVASATSTATQTSLPALIVTSTRPPPASLLDTYKVHQLDRIFTADRFYKYLLSAPSTSAFITTDDEFLTALHGITGAEDCNADLVVEAYDGMNELRRGMMAEVIKVVQEGLERDENERLDEWIKIEVPKILDEFM